jgi:CubicO group peptidase (beta-lactamase class C family)
VIDSEPVTPSTLFWCGSTTKSFTAAAVSLLIDESENYSSIAWDSPVVNFLREDWLLSDDWATEHITLEDALSHRTGYPRHDFARITHDYPTMVRNFRNLPMSAEPRVKFQYNNLMFGTIGFLVSKLTGSWLGDVFRDRLWIPMGMNSTYLSLPDVKRSKHVMADEYWYNNDTDEYENIPHVGFPSIEGDGMTISNVLDYSRYMRTMMTESLPISRAGHASLKTARSIAATKRPPFSGPVYYGLGWFGSIFAGEEVWFHAGQVTGHLSNMIMIPSRQFAVVTMLNSLTGALAQELIFFKVLYDYLDVDRDKRYDIKKA